MAPIWPTVSSYSSHKHKLNAKFNSCNNDVELTLNGPVSFFLHKYLVLKEKDFSLELQVKEDGC